MINYFDANLYDRDIALLSDHQWLNDQCILAGLRWIEHTCGVDLFDRVLFLDPSVASFLRIQCTDDEDYEDFSKGTNMSKCDIVFAVVNNRVSFDESCSHWSLLLGDLVNGQYFHFDSMTVGAGSRESAQFRAACDLAMRLAKAKSVAVKEIREVPSPQQSNCSDCGVYSLMVTRYLLHEFIIPTPDSMDWNVLLGTEDSIKKLNAAITPELASRFRSDLRSFLANLK